jgi:hypothetical protein
MSVEFLALMAGGAAAVGLPASVALHCEATPVAMRVAAFVLLAGAVFGLLAAIGVFVGVIGA